jgi:hypothetical protein
MELIHPAGESFARASPWGLHPNKREHRDIVIIVFGNGHICKQNIGMIRKIKTLDKEGLGPTQRLGVSQFEGRGTGIFS